MRVKRLVSFSLIPLVIGTAGIVIARSDGAPASKTGAPSIGGVSAEPTCQQCHSGSSVNSGATIELINAPPYYSAGVTYTFTVRVSSSQTTGNSNRMWAFELTAVNMADGTSAGTFGNVAGQVTRIINGTGSWSSRSYIQSYTGDRAGESSPVSWQVQWTAPDPGVGSVGFYAVGNAANGTGGSSGDYICTTSSVMQDVTAVEAATWGRVKALFR